MFILGVMQQVNEPDHSPPLSVEVKNNHSYTHSLTSFMLCTGTNLHLHRMSC